MDCRIARPSEGASSGNYKCQRVGGNVAGSSSKLECLRREHHFSLETRSVTLQSQELRELQQIISNIDTAEFLDNPFYEENRLLHTPSDKTDVPAQVMQTDHCSSAELAESRERTNLPLGADTARGLDGTVPLVARPERTQEVLEAIAQAYIETKSHKGLPEEMKDHIKMQPFLASEYEYLKKILKNQLPNEEYQKLRKIICNQTETSKATIRKYCQSEIRKATRRKYYQSEAGKAAIRKYCQNKKRKAENHLEPT